jgi:PIN domain nuclease of toxin-antitoxin system
MRLLLDAHALIWSVDDPAKLGPNAAQLLTDQSHELLISAGTIWEVSIKTGIGKLGLSFPFQQWIDQAIADLGAALLPIEIRHAAAQMTLSHHHGDPFDRLLAAQAQVDGLTILSADRVFDRYGAPRIW